MNESIIKTIEHEVERKPIRSTTVENETVNNFSDLITVLRYHVINECFLISLGFNEVN